MYLNDELSITLKDSMDYGGFIEHLVTNSTIF
jgi:hypothetical protein